jgi:aminoglycoside 6'-N-acetyltransferase I
MISSHKTFPEGESVPVIFTYRKMTTADISHYNQLFKKVFSLPPWNEEWSLAKINTALSRQICKEGFIGVVAQTDFGNCGYLTGFRLRFLPSIFYVDQLFIDNDFQGKSVGTRLLSEATDNLKNLGISKIFLLTKPGTVAAEFYKKNGYNLFLRNFHIKGKSIFYRCI